MTNFLKRLRQSFRRSRNTTTQGMRRANQNDLFLDFGLLDIGHWILDIGHSLAVLFENLIRHGKTLKKGCPVKPRFHFRLVKE